MSGGRGTNGLFLLVARAPLLECESLVKPDLGLALCWDEVDDLEACHCVCVSLVLIALECFFRFKM